MKYLVSGVLEKIISNNDLEDIQDNNCRIISDDLGRVEELIANPERRKSNILLPELP